MLLLLILGCPRNSICNLWTIFHLLLSTAIVAPHCHLIPFHLVPAAQWSSQYQIGSVHCPCLVTPQIPLIKLCVFSQSWRSQIVHRIRTQLLLSLCSDIPSFTLKFYRGNRVQVTCFSWPSTFLFSFYSFECTARQRLTSTPLTLDACTVVQMRVEEDVDDLWL